ncbi:hypothetical protein [Sorangium sp. So ce590]|uniref:hypothetical protein n=1 Tax=unclassified Sorangium TaxID=2621164 RepID=UPI003F61F61A
MSVPGSPLPSAEGVAEVEEAAPERRDRRLDLLGEPELDAGAREQPCLHAAAQAADLEAGHGAEEARRLVGHAEGARQGDVPRRLPLSPGTGRASSWTLVPSLP